jgi:hypothetical protein
MIDAESLIATNVTSSGMQPCASTRDLLHHIWRHPYLFSASEAWMQMYPELFSRT